jgi:hypothetical protein
VFLNSINCVIKDISHFSLLRVKYITINKKLILNLNLLVFKEGGDAIYKRVRVYKLDYKRVVVSLRGRGALIESCLGLV